MVSMGGVPVVTEAVVGDWKMNILPVTSQESPTLELNSWLSLSPTTLILYVCDCPSQSRESQGVVSMVYSCKSKASIPTTGFHNPGTTPPVKITGNGHCTPAS